jgi:hypothetical protein
MRLLKHNYLFLIFILLAFNDHGLWGADLRQDEIVTVLPKDAIPAILFPSFEEGKKIQSLGEKDFFVGVEINGDSRAYPVPILSRHEIVNDKIGDIPIAVTW